MGENVEHGLAQPVGGRPDRADGGRGERPAAKLTADDPHGGARPLPACPAACGRGGRAGARRRRRRSDRRGEIGTGGRGELGAELVAQNAAADLAHLALGEIAELEGPVGDADQAVGDEAEMGEHALDLAVLALAQAEGQPDIGALDAVERGLDGAVVDAVDGDAVLESLERLPASTAPWARTR